MERLVPFSGSGNRFFDLRQRWRWLVRQDFRHALEVILFLALQWIGSILSKRLFLQVNYLLHVVQFMRDQLRNAFLCYRHDFFDALLYFLREVPKRLIDVFLVLESFLSRLIKSLDRKDRRNNAIGIIAFAQAF